MEVSAINEIKAGVAAAVLTPAMQVEERRTMIQAVRAVNAAELLGQENELSFTFDRHSQRAVVRIVDKKTREVIQQIPNEQVLRLAEEVQQRE